MSTKETDYSKEVLEEWRDCLNKAIIQSDFDLSAPDVLDLSGMVDIMVLNEMRAVAESVAL